MSEEARFLTLRNATGEVRTERWNDRDWTVVPVVALVEGVIHPVNAPHPELVRAEEFTACEGWEGVPVHAGHPMKNGQPISGRSADMLAIAMGVVRNPRAEDKRLHMEAWLDPSKCLEGTAAGRILSCVTAVPPKMIEVSVGVFTNPQKRDGVWTNGKRFAAEWRGMRQDHLALLDEGKRGACSIEMGCGTPRVAMRVAADGQLEVENLVAEPKGIRARIAEMLTELSSWKDSESPKVDEPVIVQDTPESTPKAPCACGNHAAAAAGEVNMEKKDRIAALMVNPHSAVKSLKMLEAASDDELKALEDQAAGAATLKAAEEKAVADKAIADKAAADIKAKEGEDLKAAQARANDAEAKLKVAEANQVTDDMRALVTREKERIAAEKDQLVGQLKAAQTAFSEEQLKTKDVAELKQLAMLAKVEAPRDYSGQGIPRAAAAAGVSYAPPDPWASLTAKQ